MFDIIPEVTKTGNGKSVIMCFRCLQRSESRNMWNILAYVPQTYEETVASRLKLIWKALDEKTVRALKEAFCREYENRYPKAVECLEEKKRGGGVGFYIFEEFDSRKISNTKHFREAYIEKLGKGHL